MALQSVQVRPHETADLEALETFIESLIGQTVPTTGSRVPVFSFRFVDHFKNAHIGDVTTDSRDRTTEENVQKIKAKYGEHCIIDAVNV